MSSSALELDLDLSMDSMDSTNTTVSPSLTVPDGARILLLHDSGEAFEQLKSLFKTQGWTAQIRRSASLQDFQECLAASDWDCVILFNDHFEASAVEISDAVAQLEETNQPSLVYVDADFSVETAESATLAGFTEYLTQTETIRLVFSTAREVFAKQNQRIALASQNVLAEAHAQSKVLLDSTTDAISYVADGMIIHANSQLCTLLGYENGEEIELLPLIDLVGEVDQGKIRQIIKQMTAGEMDELKPAPFETLCASGDTISLTYHFASASYDGDPCTQIIMRGEQVSIANSDANLVSDDNTTAAKTVSNVPALEQASTTSDAADHIASLQGKGLIAFASLFHSHTVKQQLGCSAFAALAPDIQGSLTSALPDGASVNNYGSDAWLISINSTENTPELDAEALAKTLVDSINEHLQSANQELKGNFVALGMARFGVAEFDARSALDRAFILAAELQALNGGYKLFSPRIDNAAGSVALQSALELDRFVTKYQPLIGLQNQNEETYQLQVYMLNEHGKESSAASMLDSLGLEKDNVAFDQWLVNRAIENLLESVSERENLRLIVPLTNAAINDPEFRNWLDETYNRSELDRKHLGFEFAAAKLSDYEIACSELSQGLRQSGFQVVLSGVDSAQLESAVAITPNIVMLDNQLTSNLNADAENNTRERLKEIITALKGHQITCVATAISSASELAVLWQTNVPYVMGDYLQSPLSAMNYEFTDLS